MTRQEDDRLDVGIAGWGWKQWKRNGWVEGRGQYEYVDELLCVCARVKVIKSNVSFYTTLFHYALYDHQRDFTR